PEIRTPKETRSPKFKVIRAQPLARPTCLIPSACTQGRSPLRIYSRTSRDLHQIFRLFCLVHMTTFAQAATPNLTNNISRPIHYYPEGGDFVCTNGPEYFNRPLYSPNTAFRIDAGDKPEFSLYLPGRGGNLRLGIKTAESVKWLNQADTI